ncbi:ankyrin repeat-containing domain protein [Aspergillus spectabilis]
MRRSRPLIIDWIKFSGTPLGHNSLMDSLPDSLHGISKSLFLAAARGYTEIAQLLLDYGFNPNARDYCERTPSQLAAANGHKGVVAVLLGHQHTEVNAQNRRGETALHVVAKKGSIYIYMSGATPLWLAIRLGHDPLAMQLLSRPDVDVNTSVRPHEVSRGQSTCLHHDVRRGHLPIIQLIIGKSQLNPNITDHHNRTPLSWAVFNGDLATVNLLLTRSDIRIDPGAIRKGHTIVVRMLLQHSKFNINHGWGDHEPPLLLSIRAGHTEITELLLAQGGTALSIALRRVSITEVDRIIQHSLLDVNSADNRGRTALWLKRLLADVRVQTNVKNIARDSPLIVARRQHHSEIVDLLEQHAGSKA